MIDTLLVTVVDSVNELGEERPDQRIFSVINVVVDRAEEVTSRAESENDISEEFVADNLIDRKDIGVIAYGAVHSVLAIVKSIGT